MAGGEKIAVMCSGAFRGACLALLPEFERVSGWRVATAWGASVGPSPNSIASRLERGEPADLLILAAPALDGLVAAGQAAAGSRVDLARTGIAMAVRAGAPRPALATVADLERALLAARAIAISTSASGLYLRGLFRRLGIADRIAARIREAEGEPAGALVARGEADLAFQQTSELLPVPGIAVVGPLPEAVQETTVFAAGLAARARLPQAARALIAHLRTPAAAAVIRAHGLEPC